MNSWDTGNETIQAGAALASVVGSIYAFLITLAERSYHVVSWASEKIGDRLEDAGGCRHIQCHSGENRNPYTLGEGQFLKFGELWIPASAGMTKLRYGRTFLLFCPHPLMKRGEHYARPRFFVTPVKIALGYLPVRRLIIACANGLAPGRTATFTNEGRPELSARSTAAPTSAGFSTYSAYPPMASTTWS